MAQSVIGGITQINAINTNQLFVRGVAVDFNSSAAYLQGEIDAIELQLVGINNVVSRIDFNQPTPLVGNLVITEENKNSVLLTAIQNINTQIAKLNQFDLTGLPPPQTCIITTATTNQALKGLIDTNTSAISTIQGDITTIEGDITTIEGNITTIQGQITTIQGQITTINGQITTINGQITAINNKLAHFSTFNYGSDVMSGIADGTGFAAAVSSGSASGNGIFVYPNNSSVNSQIQILSAYDKDVLIRGGNQLGLYGGNDGGITNRNKVDIGDKSDEIAIGNNHAVGVYPVINLGVDSGLGGNASTTNIEGDVYFSSYSLYAPGLTPVLYADTTPGVKLGNANNFTSDPTFSGLDVIGVGVAPITLTAGTGVIAITALLGGITLTTGAGAMAFSCGAGGFAVSTGAGALSLNTGAGVLNLATSSANIEMSTLTGDISLGAGKAAGGSAGNTILNAAGNCVIQPDVQTEIYKAAFVELNDNAAAPPITANRLYQQADALYWNGQLVQGGGGNQYVLKAGDTMTGTLTLPEAVAAVLTLDNLTTAPTPTTNRLYLLNGVLNFNGAPISSGGTVQSVSATPNANITIGGTATDPTVGLATPLNATLNIGAQNITGVDAATISIVDANAANSQVQVDAVGVVVYDATGAATNYTTINKTSVIFEAGADETTMSATSILKTAGGNPFTIANSVGGGNVILSAGATGGVVSTTSPFQPSSILDAAASGGAANYVLSAGAAGNSLEWVAQGGGGGGLPLTGGTLTGALTINYDAGNSTPQFSVINTSNTAPVGGQGANVVLQNNATGIGSVGERCGSITFQADDSAGATRSYASTQAFINDPTSTAIDGRLSQYVVSNNTLTEMMRLISTSTAVRQANIAANYTTIGSSAIGSTASSTLTVQGTTNSTTSLQTPQIYNCPQIFPATSTTQVDNAVRQYQPERLYKLTDYPAPLNAPTTNGEKVIFLNPTGAPTNIVDSILQPSDFPPDANKSFQSIVFTKYVDATSFTPAFNIIVAKYGLANQPYVFIQPDIAGVLSLVYICQAYSSVGAAPIQINDLVCTTYGATNRIYFGGLFDTITVGLQGSGQIEPALNFSGQVVIQWSGSAPNFTLLGKTIVPMLSNNAPQDTNTFSGINGVGDGISTVINVSGNSGFAQPNVGQDSIVIAGGFLTIGTGTPATRLLRRLAYYDYNAGNSLNITLVNNPQQNQFNQIIGQFDLTAQFNITTAATYTISVSNLIYTTTNPSTYPASFGIYYYPGNGGQSQLIPNSSLAFTLDADPLPRSFTTGALPLTPNTASGSYYYVGMSCPGTTPIPSDVYVGLANTTTDERCCVATAVQTGPPIGWRTLSDTDWATPLGPDANVRGGALAANGSLIFTYDGINCNNGALNSNYAFYLYYSSGVPTYNTLGDAELIETGQAWSPNGDPINNVSGGNPTLPYGAGKAVAYNEVYFNNGTFNAGASGGVSYRPSSGVSYEPTNSLVIDGTTATLGADQLKPQFSSVKFVSVYRDDTKYPNLYFCATGTELQTAELPFSGGVPNYNTIQVGTSALPCTGFGGYSDEIGYTGALFITNNNLYVYKLDYNGELVVELGACVVRCANNIYAQNKLTFPANQDGTSLTLVGDTSTANPYGKPSWWAIAQDGGIYYDNTLVNNNAGGVQSLTAGNGIALSANTGNITISTTQTTGYARWSFSGDPLSGGGTGTYIQSLGQNAAMASAIFQWPPITVASGIAAGAFTAGNGVINWTGTGSISVVVQVSVMLTLYQFNNSTGTYDAITIDSFPNQLQQHIGFGAGVQVLNNGSTTTLPSAQSLFITAANTRYASSNTGALAGTLLGSATFTTVLNQGNSLRLSFLGSGNFNNEALNKYRVLFEESDYNSGSGVSLMIQRCEPI